LRRRGAGRDSSTCASGSSIRRIFERSSPGAASAARDGSGTGAASGAGAVGVVSAGGVGAAGAAGADFSADAGCARPIDANGRQSAAATVRIIERDEMFIEAEMRDDARNAKKVIYSRA
jgi:hypothetical protein